MGKHEPMTAKAIGKRIKSKGLQKLKFFCQMCNKQCRDANGFKCHLTSEAHQRQLLLFGENPNRYLNDFSSDFMKDFLNLLKRRFSTKRVYANQVYQEYIKDRDHLHMNSTRWCTLTGFVKWMGRKGICEVDHTEKGWFITYIDRDPETLLRNEELAKKGKMERDDEERQQKVIADMIERGRALEEAKRGSDDDDSEDDSEDEEEKGMLKKESEDQKITFSFTSKKTSDKPSTTASSSSTSKLRFLQPFELKPSTSTVKKEELDEDHQEVEIKPSTSNGLLRNPLDDDDVFDTKPSMKRSLPKPADGPVKKRSALDEIIEEQERWKAKKVERSAASKGRQPETWLLPGIVVRVVVKDLGSEFYNKKATVEKLVDEYGAILRMTDSSGTRVKVDQTHLETVVPREGARVAILRGVYRGRKATVVEIDTKKESVSVQVENASVGGRTVQLPFDDVSKIA